jgi:phosphatidylglycerophosphatase A
MKMVDQYMVNLKPMSTFDQRTGAIIRPTFRFMRVKASRWLAFGFGAGLAPLMPGTVGTLWAWAIYLLLDASLIRVLPSAQAVNLGWIAILLGGFWLGTWACDRTGKDLGVSDHGAMVWDEFIAFWLVLWVLNGSYASFSTQLGAFLIFRFYDMVKPPPIRYFDRRFKSGTGVMFDDILAAGFTLLTIAIWRAI